MEKEIFNRILIVDDEKHFRSMLKDQLQAEGFIVDEASSGDEAISKVALRDYTLILLDIRMEEMDGLEVLKTLRRITPNTDIIMVTAFADIPSAVESIRYGACDFLEKPIQIDMLLEKIKSLIRSREEDRRLQEIQIDFPTLVMHKLRIPLAAVKSAISLLNKGLNNIVSEKQRELLSHIDQTLMKINATINDLIDLAQLESGNVQLDKLPINLDELVPAVCSRMEADAKAKNINFDLSIDKNVPTIEIDSEKIEKVLINILDNAIKYSPTGEKIAITTTAIHKEQEGALRQFVEVSVSDNGVGIPGNMLLHIFDKYKPETPDKEKTTGLGLALCKLIVEVHGGYILAESEANKGTTIRFAVPVDTDY